MLDTAVSEKDKMSQINKEASRINGRGRVARYLTRYMRAGKPGDTLPSFRKLSQECRVSPVTATDIIRDFEEQGLLSVKPRSGIFIPETLPDNWKEAIAVGQISIFYIGSDPSEPSSGSFRKELISYLSTEPGNLNMGVRFYEISAGPEGIRQIHDIVSRDNCEACLVSHLTSLHFLTPLQDAHIPHICIYPESPQLPENNSVLVDAERIVKLQMDYLTGLGHKRIGYLHNIAPHSYQRGFILRREMFYRLSLDYGLPITSALVEYAGMGEQTEREGILKLLQQKIPPTAIICNDAHLAVLYKVAAELGITIGKDLSVIGTNDGPESRTASPQTTTIRIPRQAAVRTALDMLKTVLKSPTGIMDNQTVDVRLIERSSATAI